MKILFLHKDPKRCAELHNDEEVIAKIPQYSRLLASALTIKHGGNPFFQFWSGTPMPGDDTDWLIKHRSHRGYLFCLIRYLIKEYDRRFDNRKFDKQRCLMNEISSWSKLDKIDWTGTNLADDSKVVH